MATSTLPEVVSPAQVRRARNLRRVGLTLLALFVLAGATGLLGTRTGETTVQGNEYEISVLYPRISRPGHAVKLRIEVRREGGFGESPVRLRYSTDYFQLFDENAFTPAPDTETAEPGFTITEFEPPPGDVFVITVDTRVEPARQRGEDGSVSVLDDAGTPVLTARFATRIWP